MSDTLTPERIAELRVYCEKAKRLNESGQYHAPPFGFATRNDMLALLAAAAERATLRAERDAALAENARLKMEADLVVTDGDEVISRAEAWKRSFKKERAENARLRDLLARVQVEDRWRPMQDASDWAEFFGWRDDCGTIVVERDDGRLFTDGGHEDITDDPPTHARPLPLTPAEEAELDALRKAVAMEGETP